MTQCAVIIFWILVGLIVSQGLLVFGFVVALLRWRRPPLANEDCPMAAVILCLRGPDPFLSETLKALFSQDYPRFDVRIVVDSREDPAWAIVEEAVERCQATNVQIASLAERRETCSLKCSSVLQAISELDESFEVVALVDADTIPHRNWLRELVAPLADERVGASTGNRWYMPTDVSWGALVRYVWNAAAIVQMYWYEIAWGGTLALKMKVLHQCDLLDRWRLAFCEDTMLFKVLRKQGFRVAFVPSLLMVNREACNMPDFFGWVRRQLLTARLYHPGWLGVVGHGLASSLAPAIALAMLVFALFVEQWEVSIWVGAGLALYIIALPMMLSPVELAVRRIVRARGEPTGWMGFGAVAKALLAIPLTQVIYAFALVSTMFVRNILWRGVRYRVEGPWQIHLVEYRPYQMAESLGDGHTSL